MLIERILAGSKMPPAQAAYVGDSLSDMHDARQAGVCALGAVWAEKPLLLHHEYRRIVGRDGKLRAFHGPAPGAGNLPAFGQR